MTGIQRFVNELAKLGIKTEVRGSIVVAELDVETPSASVATDPPNDFPNAPPHWLHLPKGIRLNEDPGRASELGDGWWKWSRAHPKWVGDERAAQRWLAHARSLLLLSQAA